MGAADGRTATKNTKAMNILWPTSLRSRVTRASFVAILSKLQQDGVIQGTDVETLEKAKRELERLRAER